MSQYIQKNLLGADEPHQSEPKIKGRAQTTRQKNYDAILDRLNSRVPPKNAPKIISFGAGKNSTAIVVLYAMSGIKFDAIVFADTGNEHPKTYLFLDWFDKWLKANDLPPITRVRYQLQNAKPRRAVYKKPKTDWKRWELFLLDWCFTAWWNEFQQSYKYETLGENCLILESLPSKAYGLGGCSSKWKVEVIRKWCKETYNTQVIELVGIHYAERSRLLNKKGEFKPLEGVGFYSEYPLITRKLNNDDCINLCRRALNLVPQSSACWFCPSAGAAEVKRLREEYPDYYELGCLIEELAESSMTSYGIKGLGRSFSWRNVDGLSPIELALLQNQADSRSCSCID